MDTFIVHKEWLENISTLPVDVQDKVIAEFVRYGCEIDSEHEEDVVVQSFVNMVKSRIDYSKEQYEKKLVMSKTAGAKKKINDKEVYRLAQEGKSAKEIAEELGVSRSSIDHSEGWRRRKEEFIF